MGQNYLPANFCSVQSITTGKAAFLASLAVQAHKAEEEAAIAEKEYFFSKAIFAAAKVAVQKFHLLQEGLLSVDTNVGLGGATTDLAKAFIPRVRHTGEVNLAHTYPVRFATTNCVGNVTTANAFAPFQSFQGTSMTSMTPIRVPPMQTGESIASTNLSEMEVANAFLDLKRLPSPLAGKQTNIGSIDAKPKPVIRNARTSVTPELSLIFSSPAAGAVEPTVPARLPSARSAGKGSGKRKREIAKEYTTKAKKPKKKKDDEVMNNDMPKKAFTPYNFFFAVEREKLLSVVTEEGIIGENREARVEAAVSRLESFMTPEEERALEKRITSKILEDQCKTIGESTKTRRKHRKSHGKVGFLDMTHIISRRWKAQPQAQVDWYRSQSKDDVARYQRAVDEYNKTKGKR